MAKIKLQDTAITALAKMADGNPGAITVLMQMIQQSPAIDPDSALGGMGVILSLDSNEIYGSDIYVLHNDICEQNMPKTLAVLRSIQLGFLSSLTLKDACSRQDYSGKNIIPVDEIYEKVKSKLPNFHKY